MQQRKTERVSHRSNRSTSSARIVVGLLLAVFLLQPLAVSLPACASDGGDLDCCCFPTSQPEPVEAGCCSEPVPEPLPNNDGCGCMTAPSEVPTTGLDPRDERSDRTRCAIAWIDGCATANAHALAGPHGETSLDWSFCGRAPGVAKCARGAPRPASIAQGLLTAKGVERLLAGLGCRLN